MEWKRESSQESSQAPKYILVGDNVDKNVRPRFMRVDRQVQSIHAWHQYASLHRFDLQSVSDSLTSHLKDIKAVGVNEFLPSAADTVSICSNYIVLVSRILVEKLHFLHEYADCVPKHISHALTPEMSQKSTVIPLGVIPKNENKNEELIALLFSPGIKWREEVGLGTRLAFDGIDNWNEMIGKEFCHHGFWDYIPNLLHQ